MAAPSQYLLWGGNHHKIGKIFPFTFLGQGGNPLHLKIRSSHLGQVQFFCLLVQESMKILRDWSKSIGGGGEPSVFAAQKCDFSAYI